MLTDVVLPVRGTTDQVTVAIAPVGASGMPIVGSPLASTTVAFTKPAAYTSIDFSLPSRPSVVAGKQYAIVLSSPNEATPSVYVAWQADLGSSVGDESGARCSNGVYPGGRAWTKGSRPLGADADFFFETYILPAPANPAPGKPTAATISAVDVRSLPAAPTAGAVFTLLPSITLTTGRSVTPASTKCAAKLTGREDEDQSRRLHRSPLRGASAAPAGSPAARTTLAVRAARPLRGHHVARGGRQLRRQGTTYTCGPLADSWTATRT